MPNNHRMVDVEFFGNFSCSCKESASMMLSVGVNFWWPAITLLIFKALSPLQNILNHHCVFISSSWARCIVDVASCLRCFMIHLNSNKKISGICFLSNIISTVVVQSLSCAKHFATSWTTACQVSLSFTISWSLVKLTFIELWCHPTISSSVTPFSSCPQSFSV